VKTLVMHGRLVFVFIIRLGHLWKSAFVAIDIFLWPAFLGFMEKELESRNFSVHNFSAYCDRFTILSFTKNLYLNFNFVQNLVNFFTRTSDFDSRPQNKLCKKVVALQTQ